MRKILLSLKMSGKPFRQNNYHNTGPISRTERRVRGLPIKQEFKSLYIDLNRKIFVLNGKPMDGITNLRLEADGIEWSLEITKNEIYEAPQASSESKTGNNVCN